MSTAATPRPEEIGWTPGKIGRAAEAMVLRAFVIAERDELSRNAILDALGLGTFTPSQSRSIGQIDTALKRLVAAKRIVRVRNGVYSVVGREAAA